VDSGVLNWRSIAASGGWSLQTYLLDELVALGRRPSKTDLLAAIESEARHAGVGSADIVAAIRNDRDR
jgi:hypothetical protein